MINIYIEKFTKKYEQQVVDLIIGIQSKEFGIEITVDDQPDLKNIGNYYQYGIGGFWIALQNSSIIGTISLSDIGDKQVALRKMFVKTEFRGEPHKVG